MSDLSDSETDSDEVIALLNAEVIRLRREALVIVTREQLGELEQWDGRQAVVVAEDGCVELWEVGEACCLDGVDWHVVIDVADMWPDHPELFGGDDV